MGRTAIGHRTDLFPLPQNERCLVLSKEVTDLDIECEAKRFVVRSDRGTKFRDEARRRTAARGRADRLEADRLWIARFGETQARAR
jgi:hypothetical protein